MKQSTPDDRAADDIALDGDDTSPDGSVLPEHPGAEHLEDDLAPPADGAGKLLQRDYWGVISGCAHSPRELGRLLRERFWDFPPPSLVRFTRPDGTTAELEVGDEMDVEIRMAGTFRVRILHVDANSLTIGTVKGHPEAGRITFGAYRNPRKDVVFHIRSIARSGSKMTLLGFKALGEAMQTNTWTDFINRIAAVTGEGVLGEIRAETKELVDDDVQEDNVSPTFIAQGD